MWQRKPESKPSSSRVPAKPAVAAAEPPKVEAAVAETVNPPAAPPVAVTKPEPIAAQAVERVEPIIPAPAPVVASPVRPDSSVSRISAGLKIRGEITGTSDITIDGEVQGKVRVESGTLTVGPTGRVQADVEAREIVVNGHLLGNLKATDRVQVGSSGIVKGSVTSPRLSIDDGARLSSKVETLRPGNSVAKAVSQLGAKAAAASAVSVTRPSSEPSPVTVEKESE